MPSVINIGNVNINTPQQNASIFFGETVLTGMDANMKFNTSMGGTFGIANIIYGILASTFDADGLDGNILDQDNKMNLGGTV